LANLEHSLNGSLKVTVVKESAPQLVRSYMGGLRTIENAPEAPAAFDRSALESTRKLSGLLSRELQAIVFSSPGEQEVMLTQHAAANVDALTQTAPKPHADHTSLTGILEQVTVMPGPPTTMRINASADGPASLTGRFIPAEGPTVGGAPTRLVQITSDPTGFTQTQLITSQTTEIPFDLRAGINTVSIRCIPEQSDTTPGGPGQRLVGGPLNERL
jgi:hypothetical protein